MPVDLALVKLDLDRKWSPCAWTKWCKRVVVIMPGPVELVEVRETQHGFHVYLHLRDAMPSAMALVALQAALGSDGVREAFNIRRASQDRDDDWNSLSEVKAGFRTKGRFQFAAVLVQALRDAGHKTARLAAPRALDMEAVKTVKRVAVS